MSSLIKPYISLFCLIPCTLSYLILTPSDSAKSQNIVNYHQIASNYSSKQRTNIIAQEIAKLEVQKALELVRFIPESPVIRQIDAKIVNLRKELRSIQPKQHKIIINQAISTAANKKISELQLKRSQLITQYTSVHPIIVTLDEEIKNLNKLLRR